MFFLGYGGDRGGYGGDRGGGGSYGGYEGGGGGGTFEFVRLLIYVCVAKVLNF